MTSNINFTRKGLPSVQLHRTPDMNNDGARNLHALGNLSSINPENRSHAIALSNSYLHPMSSNADYRPYQNGPPPLPPRHDSSYVTGYNRTSGINSCYSPYSRFSPSLYSAPYGSYRAPYSRFGAPHGAYNSFTQMAEESTRPAFESIESVVEVVSSISMMLESTYHAVHSSYSALLGVVDQFSRLKDHLAQMFSLLALIRGLRWLCLKVLYLLRLRKDNPTTEAAWKFAEEAAGVSGSSSACGNEPRQSAWPFLMFIGLVIGAPWLMFKLLSKSVTKKPFDFTTWLTSEGKICAAIAAYDFKATRHGELSFRAGEKLYLAPENFQGPAKSWMLACNLKKEVGLIPANYLGGSSKNNKNVSPEVESKQSVREKETLPKVPDDNMKSSAKLTETNSLPGHISPKSPENSSAEELTDSAEVTDSSEKQD